MTCLKGKFIDVGHDPVSLKGILGVTWEGIYSITVIKACRYHFSSDDDDDDVGKMSTNGSRNKLCKRQPKLSLVLVLVYY